MHVSLSQVRLGTYATAVDAAVAYAKHLRDPAEAVAWRAHCARERERGTQLIVRGLTREVGRLCLRSELLLRRETREGQRRLQLLVIL